MLLEKQSWFYTNVWGTGGKTFMQLLPGSLAFYLPISIDMFSLRSRVKSLLHPKVLRDKRVSFL